MSVSLASRLSLALCPGSPRTLTWRLSIPSQRLLTVQCADALGEHWGVGRGGSELRSGRAS